MATDSASPDPEWLSGTCPHCQGPFEFPSEAAGTSTDCPHCGAPLDLVSVDESDARGPATSPSGLTPGDLVALFPRSLPRPKPSWAYRARLAWVCGLLVLLPLVYLGLLGATIWGMVLAATRGGAWFGDVLGQQGRGPLGALAQVLALVTGGFLLVALVRPWLVPVRRRRSGLALGPGSEPLVTAFVGLTSDALGAAHPARIEVDARTNAWAGFRGGWRGWLRGERVLTLGLPLVAVLDARELAGVLAHELGHFNQGLAFRASHLVRAFNAWLARQARERDAWDVAIERWDATTRPGTGRVFVLLARAGTAVSRGAARALHAVGAGASAALLREMELQADATQIELVGSDAFRSALEKIQLLRDVARDRYRHLRRLRDSGQALPDQLPGDLARALAELPPEQRRRLGEQAARAERGAFATHPSPAERLAAANRHGGTGRLHLEIPATALFSDFETLARQVTELHYTEDLGLPRTTSAA